MGGADQRFPPSRVVGTRLGFCLQTAVLKTRRACNSSWKRCACS